MKERPILFSGPMVRALLDGTKTQSRRALRYQPDYPIQIATDPHTNRFQYGGQEPITEAALLRDCPYGRPGDRLWVRETTHRRPMLNLLTGEPLAPKYDGGAYTVDGVDVLTPDGFDIAWWYSRKACPSIHMPRWASRILLEITGVRVERLQDISPRDAREEGLHRYPYDWHDSEFPLDDVAYEPFAGFGTRYSCASQAYRALWESINGAGSWDVNPWVWVVEFKRVAP
jgi:hypothetical protein